jgi:hypothetical protein
VLNERCDKGTEALSMTLSIASSALRESLKTAVFVLNKSQPQNFERSSNGEETRTPVSHHPATGQETTSPDKSPEITHAD